MRSSLIPSSATLLNGSTLAEPNKPCQVDADRLERFFNVTNLFENRRGGVQFQHRTDKIVSLKQG